MTVEWSYCSSENMAEFEYLKEPDCHQRNDLNFPAYEDQIMLANDLENFLCRKSKTFEVNLICQLQIRTTVSSMKLLH